MKSIDLSNLPTFQSGNNKGKIDWVSSIGYKIKFTYNNISDSLLIKDYNKNNFYVLIEYNSKTMNIRSTNLKQCRIGKLFGFREYKFKIGDIINTRSGQMQILKLTKKSNNKKTVNEKAYICKCLNCGYQKIMRQHSIIAGNGCEKCGDGVSYPEKFVIAMLSQLQIDFQVQKIFKWSGKKRYDIYIPQHKIIIEVNGEQHYTDAFNTTATAVQKEDNLKKKLALKHNIKNYIFINARKSTMEYISNSILNSNISKFYDLNSINWNKCDIQASNSYIKLVCEDWNNNKTVKELSKKYHLCTDTIQIYLRKGNNLHWCVYDKHINMSKSYKITKKVICITTGKEFNSIKEATEYYKIYQSGISDCCRGRISFAGKLNGEKLRWKYVA